jgi:hypothetical protein
VPAHFLSHALKRDAPAAALVFSRAGGAETVLASSLELAVDSSSRKRGLLGRTSLAPGHALVIAPCGGVHTFKMQFAIDVIFAAKSGRVVKIARAVKPSRVALSLSAFAAIEMAAGESDRAGLKIGDTLVVTTASARN